MVRVRRKGISQSGRAIEPGEMAAWLSADTLKITACQDLAVRLDGDRKNQGVRVRLRIKRIGQASGSIEPGYAIARLAADAGESAPQQDLAIPLHRDGVDGVVCVRIERGVEGAIRVESGDAIAGDRRPAVGRKRREISTDKNLAIGLGDDDPNRAVRIWIEAVESSKLRLMFLGGHFMFFLG
jgi:hypothetical protein